MKTLTYVFVSVAVLGVGTPGFASGDSNTTEEIKADAAYGATASAGSKGQRGVATGTDGISPVDAVVGHVGIGYFTTFAPLGMRYWVSRNFALDLGLDLAISRGNADGYRVATELGAVIALAHYHYAAAIARVGVGWRLNDSTGKNGTGAQHQINASGFLGVELFMGALGFPNVSLQGGYALQASWLVEGGTSFTMGAADPELSLINSGIFGFHIYL